MRVERASAWADAVFHVLAHVAVPYASSCFSRAYGAWAEEELGSARARTLDEDARVLASAPEDAFARMQALAWVFQSAEAVENATDQVLRDAPVDDEAARAIALGAGPIVEVLRAAAELEMPLLAERIRAFEPSMEWWNEVAAAAPSLREHTVALTPALGLRGRVLGRHIFVGVPGIAGASDEHIAWQAAHEATVHEIAAREPALTFLELERRALGRLRSRARRAGLAEAHARWLGHLDLRALGAIPDVEDAT